MKEHGVIFVLLNAFCLIRFLHFTECFENIDISDIEETEENG